VFGSPEHDDDQHAKAVRAAIAMQAAIKQVNHERKARGRVIGEIGIGEQVAEPVAQDQVGTAGSTCGPRDPSGIVGHRRDRLLRLKRPTGSGF